MEEDAPATEFSFSAEGVQLRLDIPIGVLYDTLCGQREADPEEALPFKLTVTVNNPSSDTCLPSRVMDYSFPSAHKESMAMRLGHAKPVFDKL